MVGSAQTGERLASYVHVLRALVHVELGLLPGEPRLERKRALGTHAHEDARSVASLLVRIEELPGSEGLPGAPGDVLRDVLDDREPAALKLPLLRAVREHLRHVDALLDEPTLHVLVALAHDQERHLDELPPGPGVMFDELPLDDLERGGERTPRVHALPAQPARDPWVAVDDDAAADHATPAKILHATLNGELLAAEILARAAHEHPAMPWAFHADVARLTWDRLRHVGALDRALSTELDCHWGDHPVTLHAYESSRAKSPVERLAIARDAAAIARPASAPTAAVADVLDQLRADDHTFDLIAARW